ncbi:putative transmembrane protein [Toxoplasma gondii RUB]|uniref:Transmembrane protein n=8 Tax=Toxoplasma gondii TaxID=5811 RepID=S7W7W6_TOXGG|nr:hypothetical protein TGGT1_257690 [Toxoplasma gondii GT1]KAF4641413.1 hypothetical protein TGRH88_072230 [Toxoplasma gondii]KFG31455.1 putative transmembrane protein [Toxoplasma gondii GAB2-2007-GAL-DOM2]KFG53500.1 putative transmembrane protein [Toxoplasma gondii FOU]KFG65047.1 putative transmembrane protein [Toxoplasma gondii RUB]KFH00858.1 putative transmembrane protein [Toxoplasma gondii VAND]PUA85928.1 putative transmembrane protein [Toxoplasma gondii TgCATBr9]RQX68018.1 putative tra
MEKATAASDVKGGEVRKSDYSQNRKSRSPRPSPQGPSSPNKPCKATDLLPADEVPSGWTAGESSVWLAFLCSCLVGYLCLSDGEISALLTLSAAFYTLSIFFLVSNARVCSITTQAFCKWHSASGAAQPQSASSSSESLQLFSISHLLCGGCMRPGSAGLFAIALLARVACNLRRPAYLPNDRTGDWLYQTLEVLSALLLLLLVGVVSANSRFCRDFAKQTKGATSQADGNDQTEGKLAETTFISGCHFALVTAVACGLVLKHDMNESFFDDFAWAFALYAETLAFIPFISHQPFVISEQKAGACAKKEQTSSLTPEGKQLVDYRYRKNPVLARRLWRQFLFALVISRAIQMVFWAVTFEEFAREMDMDAVSERPTEQSGDLSQEFKNNTLDRQGVPGSSAATLNIRGWCSLVATVAQLCFSLYLMKVYCSTQGQLEREYFDNRKNTSERKDKTETSSCAAIGTSASSNADAAGEDEVKPRSLVRKRFVPSPK